MCGRRDLKGPLLPGAKSVLERFAKALLFLIVLAFGCE